jgi:choice-of-anchor A domain-containing protein
MHRALVLIIHFLIGVLATSCNSNSGAVSDSSSSLPEQSFAENFSVVRPATLAQTNTVCLKDTISILSLAGTVNLAGADQIVGDVVALDNSTVQIGKDVHLHGALYLDSGAQSNEGNSMMITGGTIQGDLSDSQSRITEFIMSLSSLSATQEFEAIATDKTITSTGHLNVIAVNELTLNGGQKLTLKGAPSDIFILNVSGNFSTGGRGGIILAGGLGPPNVIINSSGSGSDVQIGGSDEINGTVIAYNRAIVLGGGDTIRGALIAGNGITVGGSNGVWRPEGFCGVTPVGPSVSSGPVCADLVCATGAF